jgi:hypothetical protein
VHNNSGAGSQITVTDLNKDGVNDIATGGELGAFVFLGAPRAGVRPKPPAAAPQKPGGM